MKRLLAKLPRSSSGSREASASSSASRLPFDIFDVSIAVDVGFAVLALVSAATCFSGASRGDFIEGQSSRLSRLADFQPDVNRQAARPVGRDRQDDYLPRRFQLS